MPVKVTTPERVAHMRNLARIGGEIKSARAALKVSISSGSLPLPDALASTDPRLATMRVLQILPAVRRVSIADAVRIMDRAGLTEHDTISSLTAAGRARLIAEVAAFLEPPAARRTRLTKTCQGCGDRMLEVAEHCGFCIHEMGEGSL